ncbi:p-loop containing nucleoside triphosphate hydrolase protein [Favolaschia claudopus]|uniref:DNA 3'-5' helicase n=1 Tax=Favolaschia claudopus TaxID=2862362 RepID=A0AAV9ZZV7_9AGAR
MPQNIRWRSPAGRETLQKIVRKLIPTWMDGLRPTQEDLVAAIMDQEDVLCCTATGDGKSAAFSIPILAMNEYTKYPDLYPRGLASKANPVGIVITPTKGLALNIVIELQRLGISAFAYCRESLADARRRGLDLAVEIGNCVVYQVVCVDPEHLKTQEWRDIANSTIFRSRIIYAVTDEVHLVNEWGADFRVDFKTIGLFLRGRLPGSISIVGLSATLAPGTDTSAICQSLGFLQGRFVLIRRSNERPNIQFSVQTLTHGLAGSEFPDLLPFLRSGRKAIIHFHSLEMLFRCYVYLWRLQSPSSDKLRRVRIYCSLCLAEYNQETIRMIDNDPLCQIILATIAFSNGINARLLLDSISMGFRTTLDIMWQEKGRAGRAEDVVARGVILIQESTVKAAQKLISGTTSSEATPTSTAPKSTKSKRGGKQKASETMSMTKARFILEKTCYIAFLNKHYQNPPSETAYLDCLAAKRALPCSLCLERADKTIEFSAPASAIALPPLESPTSNSTAVPQRKKLKLTRVERQNADSRLIRLRNSIRLQEHKAGRFLELPQNMFLSTSLRSSLLDKLLSIDSIDILNMHVRDWRHRTHHSNALYDIILDLQTEVRDDREAARKAQNAAARKKRVSKRKAAEVFDDEEEEEYEEEGEQNDEEGDDEENQYSDSFFPETILIPSSRSTRASRSTAVIDNESGRPALKSVTNTKRQRQEKPPPMGVAAIEKTFRPPYKARIRG